MASDNGKKRGRPEGTLKWTPSEEDIKSTEVYASILNEKQLAAYFGVSERTFRNRLKDTEGLSAAYKKGKALAIANVGNSLLQKARSGNVTAQIFFLKTQAGWREVERIEHTGADGGAIEVSEMAAEARREVMGRLVGISNRLRQEEIS